ncbi:SIR2-like protein [Flavobacterium sp. 9]|uniref:SIR2 family protein n=1 Tax=Flavobacterium sp. 9 TaxID=2035198 RepID=UPI000C186996|nr:SIR2 family protein [Flavobacterium sp. 9]PIF32242.1 SIR2-like protein [Flavobacterium sp. 9]
MEIPKKIRQAIKENKLVVFAGSGLSMKFGLPNWSKLVKDVISEIDIKKYNSLVTLMEDEVMTPMEILEKLSSEHSDIKRYIKNNFQIKEGSDFLLHKNILQLSGQVITTNYDNAFELASNNKIIPSIYTSDFNMSEIGKNNDNYIFKLHGSYDVPESCVIFKDQYDKLYSEDTSAKEKLKSIFAEHVILFIGFSFNDPDINLIFENLDNVFGNNNRHFILTKEPKNFENFKFLETIPIQKFEEIDSFIESCIKEKSEENDSLNENLIEQTKDHLENRKIAFLTPNPLDIDLSDLEKIIECFNTIQADIYKGTLNVKTLENIDDFDLVVIASKIFKSKIYIEDDNLKNNLITLADLCSNIPNDSIPIVFITNDDIGDIISHNICNIKTFKNAIIKKFVFKALREGNFDFAESDINLKSKNFLDFTFAKGEPLIFSIYNNNRDLSIGKKSLTNVIGRIEEQSLISFKLLNIIKTNKLLNIKASGGTGKTTIIKKVAYELYNRGYFRQGVTFNSCENVKTYNDFEDLLTTGFNLSNILNFKDYLQENFSYSKIDLLVILDNFETVVNTLNPEDLIKVTNLLKFVTDYANVVVTSRERISYMEDSEDVYSLTPLITEDAEKLFMLYYGNITSESEIRILRQDILEDLLNNNPLAIKLVTKSRTRLTHISELKELLKEHFFESINEDFSSVFNNRSDLNIERTKSIFQSINYSYTTLKNQEKIVFELLSLFPDGISLSNFKKCFDKKNSKNNISDKELRILKDKSLIEDYNGTLQLQPIIRRFADFQFNKRSDEIKMKYCVDAYVFNCFILELIEFLNNKRTFSEALRLYSFYKNNLLKVFSYMPDIEISEKGNVPNKEYFLNYINDIVKYIRSEKQIGELYNELKIIRPFFQDLPHAETFIDVLEMYSVYFNEEFDNSYEELSKILKPEDIEKRIFKDEDSIVRRYSTKIADIHSMEGHTMRFINSYILNDEVGNYFSNDLFYLGIPNPTINKNEGFYYFEYAFMFGELDATKLESYMSSLHSDEHLEIMQTTYTLSKVQKIPLKLIKKLVVTNPYTKGLKQLMEALINECEDKELLFKKLYGIYLILNIII